jgi:hypothetical protein
MREAKRALYAGLARTGNRWYDSVPRRNAQANAEAKRRKERVDELSETLHNLTPLLLTNTTLRTVQQGSTEYEAL